MIKDEALRKAIQFADVARDWNMEEVEIDGVMVSTYDLRTEFEAALATKPQEPCKPVDLDDVSEAVRAYVQAGKRGEELPAPLAWKDDEILRATKSKLLLNGDPDVFSQAGIIAFARHILSGVK